MITVWLMVTITIHRYFSVCTPRLNKKWTSVRAVMIQVRQYMMNPQGHPSRSPFKVTPQGHPQGHPSRLPPRSPLKVNPQGQREDEWFLSILILLGIFST